MCVWHMISDYSLSHPQTAAVQVGAKKKLFLQESNKIKAVK